MNIKQLFTHALVRKAYTQGAMIVLMAIMLPATVAVAQPTAGSAGNLALADVGAVFTKLILRQPVSEKMLAVVTAFTSDPKETDGTPLVSADGNYVYDGLIACPSRLPFGTEILVKGKSYTCGDRMNKRFDQPTTERFDIWMKDKSSARTWGVRHVPITIVYSAV